MRLLPSFARIGVLIAASGFASGCVTRAVGMAGSVVGGAVSVTGDIAEGAVDKVTTSDEEKMRKTWKSMNKSVRHD